MRDPEELAAIRARDADKNNELRLMVEPPPWDCVLTMQHDRRALLNMLDEAREAFDALNMEYSGCDCCGYEEAKAEAIRERDETLHGFKNFHRLLCRRFNYAHDDADWWRDQLSLIEHIAAQLYEARIKITQEQANGVVHSWRADAAIKERDEALEENKWLRLIVNDEFGDDMADVIIARRRERAANPEDDE